MQKIQVTNLGKKENIYIRDENKDILKNHFDISDLISFEKNWESMNEKEQIEYLKKIDNLVKIFFPNSFYSQLQKTSFEIDALATNNKPMFFKEFILKPEKTLNFNKHSLEIKNKILSLIKKFVEENWLLFIFVPDIELFLKK